MLTRKHLHSYQNHSVDFIKKNKRCLLCLEMGLGKTVSTLTAIADLLDSFMVKKVLVIAPLRVANSVWHKEANDWEHLKHLKVSKVLGSERERIAGLVRQADIYVINRENIEWLVNFREWDFDCIIIDESSSFKNPSSKRFKSLRRVISETNYTVLLTGTPSPNGLLDVWAQCYLVDFGKSLGRTMSGFRNRFFENSGYGGYTWNLRKGSEDVIHKLMSPYTVSMKAEDYLDLPKRIDVYETVSMKPKVEKQYKEFEKELLLELDDGEVIEAVSAATLANKLLQWSNGAVYTDGNGKYSVTHDEKIERLKELVEDNDETMLLAYNFKSDLDRLKKAFPNAVVLDNSEQTIHDWNDGKIKMLLAHPASTAHGLNLQKGGSLCVWFGLTWSLELYQQFNARLHRQGQTKPVRIIHLLTEGTIDTRVSEVIKSKDFTQNKLITALKVKHD